jgi:hypothetical protein
MACYARNANALIVSAGQFIDDYSYKWLRRELSVGIASFGCGQIDARALTSLLRWKEVGSGGSAHELEVKNRRVKELVG